mmetsp:Transcript_24853/g.57279  ORF Transcript_24853/g.57279 Transcript_24853/m.57279 type:complete len:213 (-) Transcript_24853:1798-2436(-)
MGDAESLVQVQMAHISSNKTRTGKTNLGIHVCTIHVYLSTSIMNNTNYVLDTLLKHAKGGRIGDHEGSNISVMLGNFCFQVNNITVSFIIIIYHNNFHTSHGCRCRISSMSRLGDKTNVTVPFSNRCKITFNSHEPSKLSSSSRVGLSRNSCKTSNFCKVFVKILNQLMVSLDLISGGKGVNVGKFRPGHRNHLRYSIQLHGTRPKGNHRCV